MKKILTLLLLIVGLNTFAQQKTMNASFWKVKMGHAPSFVDASEIFLTKFFPAIDGKPITIGYNIT